MTERSDGKDGVSLSDIFWRLWAWRGVVVLVPVLFAASAAIVLAGFSLSKTRYATYLISLRNIENQRYPNGAEFSPRDLVIPEVLAQLRSRFDIAAGADLQDAISVAYDSPIADSIAQKYQKRLATRNLSQAEIDTLNQNYLEELRTVMRSSLRITVDFKALGLDSSTGLALAAELPRLWTSIYTTKYRIFTDRRLADLSVTQSLEKLDTTGSVITAINRVSAMRYGLETVINDGRLSILRTSDGQAPADLLIDLENFQSIWFNPVKALALRGADAIAIAYLDELRLNISEKWRQIKAFDAALSGLSEYQRSGQTDHSGQVPAFSGEQGSTVQIGDAAFSGIVQLAQQASFTGFVQRVLEDRRNLMIELAKLEKEQEFATYAADNLAVTPEFLEASAQLLQALTSQYVQLLQTAEMRLSDRAGDLFEPLLGPMAGGDALLTQRNLLIVAAAASAGGLLAVIGVLLLGVSRSGHLSPVAIRKTTAHMPGKASGYPARSMMLAEDSADIEAEEYRKAEEFRKQHDVKLHPA